MKIREMYLSNIIKEVSKQHYFNIHNNIYIYKFLDLLQDKTLKLILQDLTINNGNNIYKKEDRNITQLDIFHFIN
jgi:hypothetical protein